MIKLRKLEKKDAVGMLEWLNDENITQFFSFPDKKHELTEVEDYINKSLTDNINKHYAIVDDNDEYCGTISLKNIDTINKKAEYAIVLRNGYSGKGYAKKATQLLMAEANKFDIETVYLTVLESNIFAIKRYESYGFKLVKRIENSFVKNNIWFNQFYYEYKVKNKPFEVLTFPQRGDERGHLVVVEGLKEVPFEIKRIFYIYGSDEKVIRGQHANRESQFVLINVSGTSKVLIDDGYEKTIIELDHPHMGIYLDKMIWKEMYDFSTDSVLLVLSSEVYNPNEYIRNYEDFIKEVKNV